jgi:hypothetical protein
VTGRSDTDVNLNVSPSVLNVALKTFCLQLWIILISKLAMLCMVAATWHSKEVLDMVDYWEPHQFAAAFADSDPERLASLLKECPLSFASSACQTWPHDQLAEVLPLLSTKVARQVWRSVKTV